MSRPECCIEETEALPWLATMRDDNDRQCLAVSLPGGARCIIDAEPYRTGGAPVARAGLPRSMESPFLDPRV